MFIREFVQLKLVIAELFFEALGVVVSSKYRSRFSQFQPTPTLDIADWVLLWRFTAMASRTTSLTDARLPRHRMTHSWFWKLIQASLQHHQTVSVCNSMVELWGGWAGDPTSPPWADRVRVDSWKGCCCCWQKNCVTHMSICLILSSFVLLNYVFNLNFAGFNWYLGRRWHVEADCGSETKVRVTPVQHVRT